MGEGYRLDSENSGILSCRQEGGSGKRTFQPQGTAAQRSGDKNRGLSGYQTGRREGSMEGRTIGWGQGVQGLSVEPRRLDFTWAAGSSWAAWRGRGVASRGMV